MESNTKPKARRGFAAMSEEKRRELSQRGGKRAHELGRARKWDEQSGALAGAKGRDARNAVRARQRAAQRDEATS